MSAISITTGLDLFRVDVFRDQAEFLCSKSKFSYCVGVTLGQTLCCKDCVDTANPNTVFNTANHPIKPPTNTQQNCAMTVQRRNYRLCDVYSVVYVGKSGARGRNRTTDTRIFNPCAAGITTDVLVIVIISHLDCHQ